MLAPAIDDDRATASVRVGALALAPSDTLRSIVSELRRNALAVDELTTAALQLPPTAPVYVVVLDATMVPVICDRLIEWLATSASERTPGMIGVVENGALGDVEQLLAAGFDDAVAAPASPRELVGRVRALHRRVHWRTSTGRLRFGDLTLDLYGRTLWVSGRVIPLTSVELAVLRELVKARGRPMTRGELLDAAWGDGDLEVSERAVDNVILRLRRKLPRPEMIETVRSVGFRLAAPTGQG